MLGALGTIIDSGRLTKRGGSWLLRGELREVGLAATGVVSRMHVANAGEWLGHPDGPFEFTAAVFDTMCANVAAQKTPLSIDYDHRAWSPDAPDSRAAGWVTSLAREGDGDDAKLYATVEWTASAAEAIRAGEFRFCSPAWTMDAIDRKSGKSIGARMLNIALTNVPFLDGQEPIKCTQRAAENKPMPDEIKDEEKIEETKAAEDPGDPVAAVNALVTSVAAAAGVDELAAIAAMGELAEKIGGLVRDKLEQDGMPSEVAAEAAEPVVAAEEPAAVMVASIKATADAASVRLMSARIQTLEADLAKRHAADAAAKSARIEADADKLIADGFALDSQRADVVFLMSTAPERVQSIFGTKVSPVGVTQASVAPVTGAAAVDAFEASLPEDQRKFYKLLAANMPVERAQARLIALRDKN